MRTKLQVALPGVKEVLLQPVLLTGMLDFISMYFSFSFFLGEDGPHENL